MSSAPKDGSEILTWAKDGGFLIGSYMFDMEDGLATWRNDGCHPRYWMPLPPLPETQR